MQNPHPVLASLLCAALLFLFATSQPSLRAQQQRHSMAASDETAHAIELYRKGNFAEALTALRAAVKKDKSDISAWHYLGLVLQDQGNLNEAMKVHEKAAKLGEKFLLNQWSMDNSLSLLQFKTSITDAADSADKYLELTSKASREKPDEWSVRAELLHGFLEFLAAQESNDPQQKIYCPKPLVKAMHFQCKTFSCYTLLGMLEVRLHERK